MTQLIDMARVSADNAKKLAGGILCSGVANTQVELLAQGVADLANAVEALAEHIQPRPQETKEQFLERVEREYYEDNPPVTRSPFIGPATCEDVAGLRLTDDKPDYSRCQGCSHPMYDCRC